MPAALFCCISWVTGLRPLRVTLLLALLLAAEAELRRAWPAVAEPGLAVAAEEELRTAELLRVPAAFPFWVVLRRTWSDWVADELRVAELEELLRFTWLALERCGAAEDRTALEELRVAELEELLRTAEDLLLDEELPEVVVVLRPVEADPLLRRV